MDMSGQCLDPTSLIDTDFIAIRRGQVSVTDLPSRHACDRKKIRIIRTLQGGQTLGRLK